MYLEELSSGVGGFTSATQRAFGQELPTQRMHTSPFGREINHDLCEDVDQTYISVTKVSCEIGCGETEDGVLRRLARRNTFACKK